MSLRSLPVFPILAPMIILGVFHSVACAQNWQGGLQFQLGFPTGDYRDEVNTTAPGVSGEILYSPHRSFLGVGLSVAWYRVGGEERTEPFSTTIPDVTVDVVTENGLAQFMLLLRLQPKNAPLLPYADGLLGLNYLYTQTTIENASNGEEVASSINSSDEAFVYGLGGGLLIKLHDGKQKGSGKPFQVFLDLSVRYTQGGEAEYLKEGSIRRQGGEVVYDVSQSKTNVATARIGVTANF